MPENKIVKTFTLQGDPVQDIDGTELRKIALRKPKGKHLRAAGRAETDVDMSMDLLAAMAGLTGDIVDDMDLADLMPMLDWVSETYLPKAPTAPADGPTSSERSLSRSAGPQPTS